MAILGAILVVAGARLYSGALSFGLGLLTGRSDRAAQTRVRIVHPRSETESVRRLISKSYKWSQLRNLTGLGGRNRAFVASIIRL